MKLKRKLQAIVWFNSRPTLNFARFNATAKIFEAVLYLAVSWRCVIANFEVLHPWEFFELNVDSEVVLPLTV
jgi:hypothetical protein